MPPIYDGIDALIEPVTLIGACRIIRAAYVKTPLGVGLGSSRFAAPAGEFSTLYAAATFETAFGETLIRDRFDHPAERKMRAHTLRAHASVQIDTAEPLMLINLTDGKAQIYGVPSAVRQGEDYAQSRAFALDAHSHTAADGVFYRSRFDDQHCVAVFGREIADKLTAQRPMELPRDPRTYAALHRLRIDVIR